MNTAPTNTAHSLYVLYETLPNEVQQAFLQELIQKKHQEPEIVNVVVASTVKTYAAILLWIFTSLVFSVYTSALSGLRWTSWILCQLRTLPLQRFGFLTLAAS